MNKLEDKIKNAFEAIRAGDDLKARTSVFINGSIQKNGIRNGGYRRAGFPRKNFPAARIAVSFASVLVVLFFTAMAYGVYFTPSAFVDVEVNPSLEIVLNRFDRVIDYYGYNPDGENLLAGLNIRHRKYSDAIGTLIEAMSEAGYTEDEGLISIALQSDAADKTEETVMLSGIEAAALRHCGTARVETYAVDGETRKAAHGLNLSAAKYLAIQDLIEVDPAATVEGCRHRSIGEIKEMTEHTADSFRKGKHCRPGTPCA